MAPLPDKSGAIFAVLSGAGGSGKSVVAANLAVAIAKTSKAPVVLVDLSLLFVDIGSILNLPTEGHVAELAMKDQMADAEAIELAMVDGPGGIRVLLAPPTPELADYVTARHMRSLIEQLQATFKYIVVDAPSYLNDVTLDVIEMATGILLLTDYSVASVKNVRLAMTVMETLKIGRDQMFLVANNHRGVSALDKAAIEGHLRHRLLAELPYEPKVIEGSIKAGVPFVTANSGAAVSQAIMRIAEQLVAVRKAGRASV